MKKGGIGGGNTMTGINFEGRTDFLTLLNSTPGYEVCKLSIGYEVRYDGSVVAKTYKKHDLYRFLSTQGIDWKKIITKKLLPDDAIYVIKENTIYILEMKYQEVDGSVDEKLQTCDFKKKQYKKLFSELNYEVEYIYILNDWFKNEKYRDVLDYVISVGCKYYFEYLPLYKIGLPIPKGSIG
jgi:hypothetical protein